MIKIKHKAAECVGCRHCADTSPLYFKMDEDGMAELIDAKQQGVFYTVEAFDEDLDNLKKSADGCPVNIILIEDH